MELTHIVTVILFSIGHSFSHPGDPVMYLPPFEVRTLGTENQLNFPFGNSQFQPVNQRSLPIQQQQLLHTNPIQTQSPTPPTTEKQQETKNHNFTFEEFVEALNQLENKEDARHGESRAAARDYEYPPYPSYPPGYGYPRPYSSYPPRPSYGPYSPPMYHEPVSAYVPPTTVHHSPSKHLKPELSSLFKPVTTKVASKVSGLIGLVLTLLTGSSPNDVELKGFKDIVINGVVKPLLLAKGGIKSLISKLTIPVISLLLINLEVLITVWWLWEDCPEPEHSPAAYPYPKPVYNNYNSYK